MEAPPHDAILGYAGLRATRQHLGGLQAYSSRVEQGRRLDQFNPDGAVGRAGAKVGDIIVAIDGRPVDEVPFWRTGCCLIREAGDTSAVVLTLLRDGNRIDMTVLPRAVIAQLIESVPDPTPEQLRVREAWLRRSPDGAGGLE